MSDEQIIQSPLDVPPAVHIQFHCHKETMMEAVAACMTFIDAHDLETPDMATEYAHIVHPYTGKVIAWYEASVHAKLKPEAIINITYPKEEAQK